VSTVPEPAVFERRAPGINGPEGVAVDGSGRVYGGGADGVVRRLEADGKLSEFAKVSDGQLGGLAFDRDDNLFVCDGFTGRVVKVTPSGRVSAFAEHVGASRLHVPNFPAFDASGDLWVSDSFDRPLSAIDFAAEYRALRPAGRLVRFAADGRGEVVAQGMFMPNGLAIDPDEQWIYVLQTTTHNCVRLRLEAPAAGSEPYGPDLGGGPDGMAFAATGQLVITMPAERRVVMLGRDGSLQTLAEDETGETLPFPTNCAFGGEDLRDLYVANMHADYLPALRLDRAGHPLVNQRPR
jgi:gluconolactonase